MGLPQLSSIQHAFIESDMSFSDFQQVVTAHALLRNENSTMEKVLGAFSVGSSALKLGKSLAKMKESYDGHNKKTTLFTFNVRYDDLASNILLSALSDLREKYEDNDETPTTYDIVDGKIRATLPDNMFLDYEGETVYVSPLTTSSRSQIDVTIGHAIRCENLEILKKFQAEVQALYDEKLEERFEGEIRPDIYKWHSGTRDIKYDGFLRENKDKTLFLAEGQKTALYKALDDFDESEQQYYDLGVPYKMGICLYGPPGTGKTSTIKAIAQHTGRDIYYVSLETLENNEMLNEAVKYGEGKIIVFEDIDIHNATHEGSTGVDGAIKGITRQGLLNVLDGINSPNDAIFVLTTNRRELLDSALTRTGRVDVEMELDYIDQYQLDCMLDFLKVEQKIVLPKGVNISGSDIMGIARQFIKDTSLSGQAIQEFISGKETPTHEITQLGDTI